MTKQDLVYEVAVQTGVDTTTTQTVINALIGAIKQSVTDNEAVTLRGFGSFQPVLRKAKVGRIIQTKEPMTIPAHVTPVFVAATEFKQLVKEALNV